MTSAGLHGGQDLRGLSGSTQLSRLQNMILPMHSELVRAAVSTNLIFKMIFLKNRLFFKVVLGSQKNWAEQNNYIFKFIIGSISMP